MYYILGLFSYVLTVCFIVFLEKPVKILGLVDQPTGRKTHSGNIPLSGGLSIFGSISVVSYFRGDLFGLCYPWYTATVLLIVVALLDDRFDLNPTIRLIAQTLATFIMIIWGDVYVVELGDLFGFGNIVLNYLSIPFTLFCVVGIINAINMIDGIDGLAGGIVFVVLFLYGILIFFTDLNLLFLFIISLSCSVLAFLSFNMRTPWRSQAKVFLGDSGSMMLGFSLAWISISITNPKNYILPPIATVWILGVPILDTISIMLRRIIKKQSPFTADREHIHHILLRAGFNQVQTVFIIVVISLIMGSVGLIGSYNKLPDYIMFYGFFIVFIVYNISIFYAWKLMKVVRIIHDRMRFSE